MAIGDVGLFTQSESQYTTPGAYEAFLTAEAEKRASYLAEIDMFNMQLEESVRQFDETLDFQEETRDLELAFGREELEQTADLTREGYALEKELLGSNLAFQREKLTAETDISNRALDIESRGESLSLGGVSEREQFDFLKDYFGESNEYDPLKSATEEEDRFIYYPGKELEDEVTKSTTSKSGTIIGQGGLTNSYRHSTYE